MPEKTMVAIDGTDALAFVIIRPGAEEESVSVEAVAHGLSEEAAAYVLRNTAQQWDPQHVAAVGPIAPDGEPLLRVHFDFHPDAPDDARHVLAELVTETIGNAIADASKPEQEEAGDSDSDVFALIGGIASRLQDATDEGEHQAAGLIYDLAMGRTTLAEARTSLAAIPLRHI